MRLAAIALAALIPLAAQAQTLPDLVGPLPVGTSVSVLTFTNLSQPTGITFGSGITIDTATGAVTIPAGVPLDRAAKQFWNAVAQVRGAAVPFPEETH